MRLYVAVVLLMAACKGTTDRSDAGVIDAGDDTVACTVLFGQPNSQTGLSASQCQPQCVCGGSSFVPPTYSEAFIQSLVDDWELATPYAELSADPYADAGIATEPEGTVCGVLPQGSGTPRPYALVTYASASEAVAAGASVTHFGACGVCSTLVDLAVYMRHLDLTAPVRDCGLKSSSDGGNADVDCLLQLGFDLPCAQIWAYNTAHTRSLCLAPCIENLSSPYNLPDGGLNACLQCDEDKSGPVFKAVAGRTRRNTGIPNAICRPCSQVKPLVHAY